MTYFVLLLLPHCSIYLVGRNRFEHLNSLSLSLCSLSLSLLSVSQSLSLSLSPCLTSSLCRSFSSLCLSLSLCSLSLSLSLLSLSLSTLFVSPCSLSLSFSLSVSIYHYFSLPFSLECHAEPTKLVQELSEPSVFTQLIQSHSLIHTYRHKHKETQCKRKRKSLYVYWVVLLILWFFVFLFQSFWAQWMTRRLLFNWRYSVGPAWAINSVLHLHRICPCSKKKEKEEQNTLHICYFAVKCFSIENIDGIDYSQLYQHQREKKHNSTFSSWFTASDLVSWNLFISGLWSESSGVRKSEEATACERRVLQWAASWFKPGEL